MLPAATAVSPVADASVLGPEPVRFMSVIVGRFRHNVK